MNQLRVIGWWHHYRTANRMTDQLANVAMDENNSREVWIKADPHHHHHQDLVSKTTTRLNSDFAPWLATQHPLGSCNNPFHTQADPAVD